MSIETIKRICARVYGVGQTKVKIIDQKKAKEALTTDDVKELVKEKVIIILPNKSPSRAAARRKLSRIRMGRRRGRGSKKGTAMSTKRRWIEKVRAQRRLLFSLKNKLKSTAFRALYRMIKGNAFRNKRALSTYLHENKMVVE